ncbi:2-keto-4-pentenoate hydratase [Aliikangiella sp. G2MR2-5]|uniref:2-keto-4-pentenoate hydratase n=1 Tax=Aliikangiella sp. G2MR2-5 TaxID=2788943 RepID=UPI0018A8C0ED|nr:fumarylacetoacetate hydrolase family protein [Aliikangiella sp. G2MR2-5]
MNNSSRLCQLVALFYLLLTLSPATASEKFIQDLQLGFTTKSGMPHLSKIQPQANLDQAYSIQHDFVLSREESDDIAGYKAGLTSKPGQEKFKVKAPLSGVLFVSGHKKANKVIRLSDAGKLMLETEIGYLLSKAIAQPIESNAQLELYIEAIVPVIELPDLAFKSPKEIKGIDLVAANLASHQFILGKKYALKEIEAINEISTQLKLNGETVISGKATDASGDQLSALRWLINHLLAQGYKLEAGNLLITGALGKMIPARSGDYVGDFGTLGQIKFSIE